MDTKLPPRVMKYFQAMGKLGGEQRKRKLTPERRREIAQIAARVRWKDHESK